MEKYISYTDLFLTTVLVTAVIYDLRYQKIPNWLTFSTLLLAVSYHLISDGIPGLLFALEGSLVGVLVLIFPYLMGGMGAGDAKLMGAVGGLLGPKGIFVAFLLTALIGGVYALVVLAYKGNLGGAVLRYWFLLKTFLLTGTIIYIPPPEQEKNPRLKYGVAIALGTMISVLMKNNIYEMLNLN